MILYVSHLSALRYWRQVEGLSTTKSAHVSVVRRPVTSIKEARLLKPKERGLIMSGDHPLDALVTCKGERRYAKELVPHLCQESVPEGAFRRLAPNIYISSPEFVFVQMASSLSVVELAQLGNELCGGYFLRGSSGFCERPHNQPVTTRARLLAFAMEASSEACGIRGARKAVRALAWVVDHCNSPMETICLLALCLPGKMGGWSLRMPQVNERLSVGERLRHYVKEDAYTPDFLWVRKVRKVTDGVPYTKTLYIVGEYDSHDYHDDEADAEHTRIRRDGMESAGYLVTSINKSQIACAEEFQYPARQIARDLGLYRPVPSEDKLKKQNNLLRLLRRESFR